MKLIQISDCHLFQDKNKQGYGEVNPYQSLVRVLTVVKQAKPDGIIITGDISGDDSPESYQHLIGLMTDYCCNTPWRVIPGNHDNNPFFAQYFADYWLQAGVPWVLGEVALHGLDSRWQGTQGKVDKHQLALVEKAVKALPDLPSILAIHHHPVATRSWMDKHCLHDTTLLAQHLADVKPILLIHGHIHADHQTAMEHVPVLGVPSSGWQWALTESFSVDERSAGFRTIEYSTGRLTTSVTRVE